MNLKELKEAQLDGSPVKFMGEKCVIHEICNEYVGVDWVTTVTLVHAVYKSWESIIIDLESVTPWEEPTNKGENMKTQEEKTLELIKAALAGETILSFVGETSYEGVNLIQAIVRYPSHYSIKPKTKAVKYQTRLYLSTGNEVRLCQSFARTQDEVENFSWFKRWIEPTRHHTCEYEAK